MNSEWITAVLKEFTVRPQQGAAMKSLASAPVQIPVSRCRLSLWYMLPPCDHAMGVEADRGALRRADAKNRELRKPTDKCPALSVLLS